MESAPKSVSRGHAPYAQPAADAGDVSAAGEPLRHHPARQITGLDFIGIPVYAAIRPSLAQSVGGPGQGDRRGSESLGPDGSEQWHAEHLLLPLRHATEADLACHERVLDTQAILRRRRPARPGTAAIFVPGWDPPAEAPICAA